MHAQRHICQACKRSEQHLALQQNGVRWCVCVRAIGKERASKREKESVRLCMRIYIYMSVHTCVHIYIYLYICIVDDCLYYL